MLHGIQELSPLLATLGLVLLHFLWQGCVIALVLTILLALVGKGRARLQYALGCAALALIAAGPVATFAVLWPERHATQASAGEVAVVARTPGATEAPVASAPPAGEARRRAQAIAAGNRAEALSQKTRILLYRLAPWLPLAWGVGVGIMSLRLVAGAWGVALLRRRRVQPADAFWCRQFERLAVNMGIRRTVRLMTSGIVRVPMAVGWLRPVVLLPTAALTGLTPGQLRLLLAHELAHLRRWDHWVNLLQLLVETLLFYHPAVWWVSNRIREAREHCCDDAAASLCEDAVEYAEALAAMAHLQATSPAMALSASGGNLFGRIKRLLEPSCPGPQGAARGLVGLAALVLVVGVVVASRAAFAQEAEARYVVFPDDHNLGQLYIRDAGTPFNTGITSSGNGEGWRTYTQARGTVEVPAGAELMLALHAAAAPHISALAELGPDDLQKLDMAECVLHDDDLKQIEGLTGLRSLVLHTNRDLSDAGLAHLKDLTGLVWLSLERTAVTCDSALFDNLPDLEYLDVYDTRLTDAGFARLCRLPRLKTLGLEKATVTPEMLASLRGLRTLEEANLEDTAVDDSTLAALGTLPSLRYLNVARTHITDAGLKSLAQAPALEVLNVKFTSIGDDGVAFLGTAPQLKRVETEGSQVTKEGLALLASASSEAEEEDTRPAQHSTNPDAPCVGLLMSHFSATGPHWIEKPYGYQHQFSTELAGMLEGANFEVYALIEPGTENEGELPDVLAGTRLTGKTIDATDVNALRRLDVIFTKSPYNMRDEVIQALTKAVSGGVGLVAMGGMGAATPGPNEALAQLLCIDRPGFFFTGAKVPCRVVATHPILKGLRAGDTLTVGLPSGYGSTEGSVRGQPLLALPEETGENFYPMYVSTLGRGRVVGMQWFEPGLPDNPFPGRWDIYVRAVNWAAGESPDTQW